MIDLKFYIEKFKQMDSQKRYLIFGGIVAFIIILDIMVILSPQISIFNKLNKHIKARFQQLEQIKTNIERKKQWQQEIVKLQEQISQARLQVASQEEVSFVLETISRLAEKNTVYVDQITPQTPNRTFLTEDQMRRYYILPIVFKGRASYHSFGKFLNDLENNAQYFKIADFSLKPMIEARLLNVTLTVHIIIYENIK